jgi:hypothetical protein
MGGSGATDQRAKHHRRGARIVEGGVGRRHVEGQLGHQPSQSGGLALGEVEHEPGQRRGVDDRVLKRALEPATHQPGIKSVVAVLDQNGALGEAQEGPARIAEFGRADQHRTVDVMPLFGVGVDRRAAVDQGVEEGERSGQLEPLGAQLEDQERGVAGRLDVDGDELGVVQRRLRAQLRRVDRDLLPRDRLRRAARLEEDRLHDCRRRAVRRNWSSSRVIARSSMTAAA